MPHHLGCFGPGKQPEWIHGRTMCEFTKGGNALLGQWPSRNTCQAAVDFLWGMGVVGFVPWADPENCSPHVGCM